MVRTASLIFLFFNLFTRPPAASADTAVVRNFVGVYIAWAGYKDAAYP